MRVTAAVRRVSGASNALTRPVVKAPSSASPATAMMRMGGAAETSAVATPAPRPSSTYVAPPAIGATHRRVISGCESGPAMSAAVRAAKLSA